MDNAETAWAYLPNAKHIDAVLAHVREHPDAWNAAWNAVRYAAWGAAWGAARHAVRDAARDAAWDAARDAARGAARDAALALIAWDDCVELLYMPPDAIKVLANCGNHAALLLYPAAVAMEVRS